jgi:hypothetical protein
MVDVDVSQPLHSLVCVVHILHCMLSPHSLSSLLLSLVVGSSDIYRKPTLCCSFSARSLACSTQPGPVPLSPRCFLLPAQI